jgi:hypothetical protein
MELTSTYETDENYYIVLLASGLGSKTLHRRLTCVIPKEGIFSNTEIIRILGTGTLSIHFSVFKNS